MPDKHPGRDTVANSPGQFLPTSLCDIARNMEGPGIFQEQYSGTEMVAPGRKLFLCWLASKTTGRLDLILRVYLVRLASAPWTLSVA